MELENKNLKEQLSKVKDTHHIFFTSSDPILTHHQIEYYFK